MALDMLEVMRVDDEFGHVRHELRVGINSGPVVAGVIGRKRFLYDLWGDAVNTASRMESHGTPGRVQITRATYELLAGEFECEPGGRSRSKGREKSRRGISSGQKTTAREPPTTRPASQRSPTEATPGHRATPDLDRRGD